MHVRELADLAALVCVYHAQLVAARPRLVDDALESYWTASRCRLDRWCRGLRLYTERLTTEQPPRWPADAGRLVEEVFVSELLTRAFAAILSAHDQRHGRTECDPVGRNVLGSHLDATRRAARLLAFPTCGGARTVASLEALRQRCHRWSDLLLACLCVDHKAHEFAPDPRRMHAFARDWRGNGHGAASSGATAAVLSAGIRMSFDSLARGDAPNADLNRQIAAAVLACFGPEFFDSHGLLRSAWLDRLQVVPDETLALLDEWWQPAPTPDPAPFERLPGPHLRGGPSC